MPDTSENFYETDTAVETPEQPTNTDTTGTNQTQQTEKTKEQDTETEKNNQELAERLFKIYPKVLEELVLEDDTKVTFLDNKRVDELDKENNMVGPIVFSKYGMSVLDLRNIHPWVDNSDIQTLIKSAISTISSEQPSNTDSMGRSTYTLEVGSGSPRKVVINNFPYGLFSQNLPEGYDHVSLTKIMREIRNKIAAKEILHKIEE